ncbi:MAG TPA: hypothetical protein P5325_01265, partial [Candidatus Woesebacteria bacterium]|nr:hypothetical protein [Candidatus Woesebacteria bacterium]
QAFQASSFKTDPDFHQDDAFVRACPEFNSGMTVTISVILNLIQNQLDPDFRQDDSYGDDSVR